MSTTTTASAAFVKLADYFARCRDKANDLPMQQDAVSYWSGVGFVLDGKKYVAPLDEVSEILTVPAYTRIPGAQTWMKGVANVRGRLMTVMDLSGFLDKVSPIQEKRRRLLVLDYDDLYTGMAVDEVMGMQHFPIDSFVESLPNSDVATAPFVRGAYKREGEYWSIFSLIRLAEDPRFMQVARTG
ncbi:MAG: chemotaxis protein CheW [Alcanivorax sp.]|nr:chemotaxis protein CheW [Alcanivorax sp.]